LPFLFTCGDFNKVIRFICIGCELNLKSILNFLHTDFK